MKYTAKGLETEPYKAYSRDAFNDEEKGVAYFAHGYRCAGKTGEVDNILRALIDTTRYIETSLPGVDKIIITADDGSDKEIKMFPIDWFWIVDFDLINWYGMGNERSSGENRAPVSEEFYDMWENYRSRASSHKKKHPKPSAKDGIQIENCGADYFFKTNFVAARAHAEMVYKKYTHVHSEPKLEWLAVPEDRPISDLELRDYMFYERESALNLAIEISAALADFLKLDKKHGNGNMVFYNITLFELKQRLLPDLLKTNAIYFRIAIARTFIYALLNLFTDQMNSGWEDADTQTQYKKIEAWVAQLALFLRDILRKPSRPLPDEYISAFFQMRYSEETIMSALNFGFGSVMFDGSRLSYEENIEISSRVSKIAHQMGAHVEFELGSVGGLEAEDGTVDEIKYTDPMVAAEFLERTDCDFLAVSIGTVHGTYKSEPNLNLSLLREIRNKVSCPLVLHGGSGLSNEDFRNTISGGISKINVYTDIVHAGTDCLRTSKCQVYADILLQAESAMCRAAMDKMMVFGSQGCA